MQPPLGAGRTQEKRDQQPSGGQKDCWQQGAIMLNTILVLIVLLLSAAMPVSAADFLLFYSNNVQGETAPCG
jgi:hypothetical protein